jgi:hypothetical protein
VHPTVGTAFVPDQDPRNPNVVLPLAGMEPLYDTFLTVTEDPDWVSAPFHSWVMR